MLNVAFLEWNREWSWKKKKSVKILRLEGKNCKRKAKEIIKAISLSGNYIFSSSSPIFFPHLIVALYPVVMFLAVLRIFFMIIFIKNNKKERRRERENDENFSILI